MPIYTNRPAVFSEEPDGPFDLHLVAGETSIPAGEMWHVSRPQGMDGWMLNLTIEGKGCINLSESLLLAEPGDVLLFPPGSVHDYDRASDAITWKHYWVYFRPRAHWRSWLQWPMQDEGVFLSHLSSTGGDERRACNDLLYDIGKIELAHEALSQALAMNLLEQVLIRIHSAHSTQQQLTQDLRIQTVCTYLEEHHAHDDSIDFIAAQVQLSGSRLQHLFKAEMGVSLVYYRDELRMLRAKQLLRTTGMPIKHIANEIGYKDALYFSRMFKQHVQATPSAFRNSLK
ncbi:MAG: arabinose operon transcriptional regulator AraC [Planctomycetes bacterium]|nr:arabinose operon transcriptional regulator AraC [Planctomycetota bacterium]